MASLCKKCSKNITDKQPGIECGFCLKFYHGKCLALTKEQITLFTDIQGSVYKCESCRSDTTLNDSTVTSTLMQALNDLKDAVKILQEEVKQLKLRKDEEMMDAIIQEINERKNKEKNIIIYNLEEHGRNKKETDIKQVKDILATIAPEVETNNIKVQRLGKSTENAIAPIRVVLSSKEDVFRILSVKKNLRNHNINIQISVDRTKRQQSKLKQVVEDMNRRQRNGEDGLFIKYINGEPVIGTKN